MPPLAKISDIIDYNTHPGSKMLKYKYKMCISESNVIGKHVNMF